MVHMVCGTPEHVEPGDLDAHIPPPHPQLGGTPDPGAMKPCQKPLQVGSDHHNDLGRVNNITPSRRDEKVFY